MTRSELTAIIAEQFPQLTVKDVEVSVAEILHAIARTLVRGDRVEIRGFGSFSLNYRQPRIARNPKTGAKVTVPGKYVPHFKSGKALRDMVDHSVQTVPLCKAA